MEWQKSITEALLLSLPQCYMKDNRTVPFCTRNAGKKKSEGQLSVQEMLGGKKKKGDFLLSFSLIKIVTTQSQIASGDETLLRTP